MGTYGFGDRTTLERSLEGLGCGVLLILRFTYTVLPPGYEALLHPFPVANVFWGPLIDLLCIATLAAGAFRIADRLDSTNLLWLILPAGVIPLAVYDVVFLRHKTVHGTALFACMGCIVLFCFALWAFRAKWFGFTVRLIRGCLVLLGCSALWLMPELIYCAARSSVHEASQTIASHQSSVPAEASRIVWLVFDELSYAQTYDHRLAGLNLPNFDRLSSESVEFTNVHPAGFHTQEVIPSLLLGETVSKIKVSADGELSVYLPDVGQWRLFDGRRTVFADLQRLGWESGIAGWYFPYCRTLAGVVDSCSWVYHEPLPDNLDPEKSILSNAVAPYLYWLSALMPGTVMAQYGFNANLRHHFKHEYDLITQSGQILLNDPSVRFAYVHVNLPHPPGIYNRRTHSFSKGGSYLDNLALADQTLGRFLDSLERTPAWSHTTLIVCGDHSWRVGFWAGSNRWTTEDQAVSMGHFDDRPVLEVHFPAQHFGATVLHSIPGIALHNMIEDIAKGRLQSAEDLVQWTYKDNH